MSVEERLERVFIVLYYTPVAPLGLRCTRFRSLYTPSAPPGLKKDGTGIPSGVDNQYGFHGNGVSESKFQTGSKTIVHN